VVTGDGLLTTTPFILEATDGTGITTFGATSDSTHSSQTNGFIVGWGSGGALFSTDTISWVVNTDGAYYIANNLTTNGMATYGQTLCGLISAGDVSITFQDIKTWTKTDSTSSSSDGKLAFSFTLSSIFEPSYSATYYVEITGLKIS
jgi:hypothetical protein